MKEPPTVPARFWILALIGALAFLFWTDRVQVGRVLYVSGLAGEGAVVNAASPTGYAEGRRGLLLPGHSDRSYRWVMETQQMFARRAWRVRPIEF